MNADTARMNRLTLRFADEELEKAFAEEQARKSLRPIRIALICGAALTLFVLWPAIILANSPFQERMPEIAALLLATIFACYALTHRHVFLYRHQWLMLAMACLMSLGMMHAVSQSPTFWANGFFLMTIHLFSIYGVFRLRFPAAVAGGWISMAMYLTVLGALGLLPGIRIYLHTVALLIANLWGMLICYQMDFATRRAFLAVRDVAVEKERAERLLLNILPTELAQDLSATGSARPARHESVSILFTDFSGFTQAVSSMPAERMVAELNEIFAAFDDITDACGVEKIKTIGDAYMAAAGLPKPCADHAQRCVRAGLCMIDYLEN